MVKKNLLSKNERDYIESIYSKVDTSFSSPTSMWSEIKRRGNTHNLSLSKVRQFYNNQSSYVLQRDSRDRIKKPSYVSFFPGFLIQYDISFMLDLSRFNDNNRYILGVIDSFSRFAYVRALKSKDDRTVSTAMKSILDQMPYSPILGMSDLGSEFRGRNFTSLLREYGCKQYYSQTGSAYHIERFFRSLKKRISTYLLRNNTKKYYHALQQIVNSYNHTPTKVLGGLRPVDVTRKNQYQVYLHMKQVRLQRESAKSAYKYKLGDKVIMSLKKNIFYKQMKMTWSNETFTVIHRYRIQNVNMYKITDCKGENIVGTFYESELQKIEDPTQFYEVDKLIKSGRGRKLISLKHHPKPCQVWVSNSDYQKILNRTKTG